jgi:hypothetical protein
MHVRVAEVPQVLATAALLPPANPECCRGAAELLHTHLRLGVLCVFGHVPLTLRPLRTCMRAGGLWSLPAFAVP